MEQTYFYIILGILIFNFVLGELLDYLNSKRWSKTLPEELKVYYDEEKYRKAQEYNREKRRLGIISSTLSFIAILVVILLGGFGWLHTALIPYFDNLILFTLVYFGVLGIASDLLGLPFSLYNTFVIEEKYGFNRTTVKIFIVDKLKGYLLAILIGGLLMAAILWFILETGQDFWLYAWLIAAAFIVFANFFYTSLIIPLFNKLSPLEEGELREKIVAYAESVNFPLKNILVMDSSKRSSKGNAFFSGFGRSKKIVLFDTLIEQNSPESLVAILAHEVGHYKKKHIVLNLVLSLLQTGIMLFIFSRFVFSEDLSAALGAPEWSLPVNIIAFGILYEPISLILGLLMNYLSRKHEYQADAFAAKTADGTALKEGLIKLHTDHFANLRPHPAYVFFHYSHPPLLSRLKSIENPA
ncbi:MAG: M48 family metallopeptidase [Bacteroidia bacterium]